MKFVQKFQVETVFDCYFLVFRFNDKYPDDALELQELEEGDEPDLFWDALRGDQSHISLKNGIKNNYRGFA